MNRGVVDRVWSVASGPYEEVLLFLDDANSVVHQLGDPVPTGEPAPANARAEIERVVTDVLAAAKAGGAEASQRLSITDTGREISFRAHCVLDEASTGTRFVLRVDRANASGARRSSMRVAQRAESFDSFYEQIALSVDSVFWMTDAQAYHFLYVSPLSETVLGIKPAALIKNPDIWMQNIVPEDQGPVIAAMREAGIHNYKGEYRMRRPTDGRVVWVRAKTFALRDEEGMVIRVGGIATDITAQKEAELRLLEQAERDALTQSLNRRGLGRVLSDMRAHGTPGSAILLDCDNFQDINDKFGHAAGDVVLRQVAERIMRSLRPGDAVGRVGGDEFVALLPNTDVEAATELAERIRVAVARTHLRVATEYASVSASFGVAAIDGEVVVDQLIHRVESAVRTSKKLGKNRVHGAGSEAPPPVASLESIRESMLRGDGFRVVAQQIRRVDTGEAVAHELLTRRDSLDPLKEPRDFFAFAIEQSIVTSVDLKCLAACLAWARERPGPLDVHINLYPSTLLELAPETLPGLFGTADLRRFHIEIVEDQFIADPEYLVDSVRSLQRLGAHVVLDDIGFGQSSLEALVVLEPDGVKIDQRVIRGAATSPAKRRQLERIVKIVNSIGAVTVAEGIEVAEDLKVVQDLGIPFGQGFLWDRPQ
jgi:diguanylate cyclase (GGDEF)-like protein/PAS domain S-box-containing protein